MFWALKKSPDRDNQRHTTMEFKDGDCAVFLATEKIHSERKLEATEWLVYSETNNRVHPPADLIHSWIFSELSRKSMILVTFWPPFSFFLKKFWLCIKVNSNLTIRGHREIKSDFWWQHSLPIFSLTQYWSQIHGLYNVTVKPWSTHGHQEFKVITD